MDIISRILFRLGLAVGVFAAIVTLLAASGHDGDLGVAAAPLILLGGPAAILLVLSWVTKP